jgi:hypothetical protein
LFDAGLEIEDRLLLTLFRLPKRGQSRFSKGELLKLLLIVALLALSVELRFHD